MKNKNNSIQSLILTALFIAVIFVSANFIKIPTAGGFVHLGDCMVLLAAVVLGKKKGAVASALGMALVDLSAGYLVWAPFTFVIKGIMAYIVAALLEKQGDNTSFRYSISFTGASVFMVVGYFLAGSIIATFITGDGVGIIGGLTFAAKDILGNILQGAVAVIIAIPLTSPVLKAKRKILN